MDHAPIGDTRVNSTDELLAKTQAVWARAQILQEKVEEGPLGSSSMRLPSSRGRPPLSARESAVIAAARIGLTTKEIAARLGISHNTAAFHLANIYRKLGSHSRVEALNAYRNLVAVSRTDLFADVLQLGTRLAAHMSSPGCPVRATYFRVKDGIVSALVEIDNMGVRIGGSFPLAEHPFMHEIVSSLRPQMGTLKSRPLGPTLNELVSAAGVTVGAGVPIAPGGALHGVLSIAARGAELPPDSFERLVEVGQMMEFGLSSAQRRPYSG